MKLILAICLTALSTFCAGQGLGLDDLPDCAKPCTLELPPNCRIVDIKCICASQEWISRISCCVAKACTEEEQKTTVEVAQQLCAVEKVTLPTAAVCPDASGASTATSSASPGRSSTAMAPSTTTGAQRIESTTSPSAAAATAGEAGSSSGAGPQHVAPGLCGVAAIFGLAML